MIPFLARRLQMELTRARSPAWIVLLLLCQFASRARGRVAVSLDVRFDNNTQ